MSSESMFAHIALPLPISGLFTYLLPGHLADSAEIGRRALAPFGPRILTGFIVEVTDDPGPLERSKIKPLMDIIDDAPVFDRDMLAFASWMADYYLCSLGEVLRAAMPQGTMVQSKLRVYLTSERPDPANLSSLEKKIIDLLRNRDGYLLRTLEQKVKSPAAGIVRALERKGFLRIEREISAPAVKPRTERHVFPASRERLVPVRAKKQRECLDIIEAHPEGLPLGELLERHRCSRGVVNALVDSGAARYEEVEVTRRSHLLDQERVAADFPLTGDQERAVGIIREESADGKPRTVLLSGVTGSGKTRVYIELVREALSRGRGAIILVPEISLTPQTTRFFTSVFPENVAVLHSAMSPGERFDMWRAIQDGDARIVIGPRSAIFAPVHDLGVIIVDEEHDSSYKQTDTVPRYHARDAAVYRGHLLGIPVVLGTATPSMESWHNVKTGKYRLAELPHRIEKKPLPEVVMVNMKEERQAGNWSSLSNILREELALRIERGEKSIILINRRGFAASVHCQACGYILTCPSCAVGLTYHASKGLAVCHLCGHREIVLEHCPECGGNKLLYKGMGTQKIEEELAKIAGHDAIVRMDSDTTASHDGHFRLLEEFRTGGASILLGTQMVAKGLDIHEVTLVGIISADLSLFIPDFRAFERTFQLITQVAGRAGRGDVPGLVVLQTYNPDNHAILTASHQDFPAFAEPELEARRELSFPPFSRLILLEMSSDVLATLKPVADSIAGYLRANLPEEVEVLGPVDAPIARKRGRHRLHILLKAPKTGHLKTVITGAIEKYSTGKESISVDVDPLDLM